ncbi:MAG: EAL domain-containing protein [Sphingomonadaceae bacterium]|nr:EAL domain-containing protein [Sphingomonadaceae bacterium]
MAQVPAGTIVARARTDLVAGAATFGAILLFVWLGGQLAGRSAFLDAPQDPSARLLDSALLLNIALILFGWRRYRDLKTAATDQATAEERAQTLATKDALTGFPNRRALVEEGSALLARAEKRRKQVALIAIDLDHFKNVNDVHGHATGDRVLRAAGEAIVAALPPSALVARLDGDAFAVALLFDPEHPSTVDAAAEQIIACLARPVDIADVHVHLSASMGISASDEECATVDGLMRRAQIAMRQAKHRGRNRHIWFDASMERELVQRSAIETGMRDGIPRGEFVPFYEQQIDLATGRIQGFEMLARWQHPTQGLISPDTFIPIAEESGMIADLSLAVMRRAFLEARDWDNSLSLSVNISPAQLRDPWLAQKIVKLLVETGFPAQRLEIEITETALFDNLHIAQSIIGSLKNQGIRIALDDFGTGYSSLAHLRALPFDRIKIDKSFVLSLEENPESAAIVNAIARLGESLNLPITAEGIETSEIGERLMALGCTKGQGWHYGKPMTVTQTRRLLAEQGLLPSARSEAAARFEAPAEQARKAG